MVYHDTAFPPRTDHYVCTDLGLLLSWFELGFHFFDVSSQVCLVKPTEMRAGGLLYAYVSLFRFCFAMQSYFSSFISVRFSSDVGLAHREPTALCGLN